MRCLLLLLFVLANVRSSAQSHFDFNSNCRQAYADIVRLQLISGHAMLEAEKHDHPDNLIPYFLENYIDFFTLFFNEDPAIYKLRKPASEQLLSRLKAGDANSPFYLFSRSVVEFQWAAIDVKFGKQWQAAWEFRRSFIGSRDNLEKFPAFQPSLLLSGAMEVAAGSIPPGYKWLSNLLGIRGSIDGGMKKIDAVIGNQDEFARLFHDEGIFYKLYLQFYIENKKEIVFHFIKSGQVDYRNNYLFAYMAANLALNNQEAPFAEKVIRERNMGAGYFQSPVWDLEMGYAKADHLDPEAIHYLERFIQHFRGKFYVKDVLQKISWLYFLQGNLDQADRYRALVLQKGNTATEADKQAQKDATSDYWPNPILLRARLLDDGGYFNESLELFNGKTAADFNLPEEKLEFAYRLGRLYDALNRKAEAIESYRTAFRLGENRKEYYAARACLQIGFIYENQGAFADALRSYQQELDLNDHDYKNALDQKAKAGIERCKGK